MSTFPQRVDVLSYVPPATPTETGAPSALLGVINDAIRNAEQHLGFALTSGGDIRHDGTTVPPGPGRRILPLTGTWNVTATQEGLYGLYVPLSDILDTQHLRDARLTGLVSSNPVTDLLGATTSPLFVHVRRRRTGQKMAASPVLNSTGEVLLAVSFADGLPSPGFVAGEVIDVFVLLWGGA